MTITTIDKVVRASIAEAGYKNLRKYILFLHFAFDALYKLKRDNVMLGFRYLNLPVVDRRAVFPATVIGVGKIGSGMVPSPFVSLDPSAQGSGSVSGTCGGCGAGGGGVKYRIDRSVQPAEIVFAEDLPSGSVYVEVIDELLTPNTETIVTSEGVLPMKSYIHFRNARFKMGAASAESVQAEKEYLDEMDEAMAAVSDLTYAGILSAITQSGKR